MTSYKIHILVICTHSFKMHLGIYLLLNCFNQTLVLLSYEFTEASIVTNSEIEIQDRNENTSSSSDSDKEGFSDAFSDFDKELKQEIKKGLDVTELGASSFSMLVLSFFEPCAFPKSSDFLRRPHKCYLPKRFIHINFEFFLSYFIRIYRSLNC